MTNRGDALSPADLGKSLARGPAQILLQPNTVSGLLILLGIGIQSLPAALGGVVGLLFGTAASLVAGFEKEDIVAGLYGYNGALVGIALFSLFPPSVVLALFAALGGILSTILLRIMKKRGAAAYTFPFVVTTWLLLALLRALDIPRMAGPGIDGLEMIPFLSGGIRGIGQVMFRPEMLTGVVFFVAILISSRPAALFAVAGSLVGLACGRLLGVPIEDLAGGLYGFNAVLCGIAFAGWSVSSFLWAVVAMVLATAGYYGFYRGGVPALTFPFVASTWVVMAVKGKVDRIRSSKKQPTPGE